MGSSNEAYIYAGCYGNQGNLRGKVIIPTNCFKIIVVVPVGDGDVKRIDENPRIIAVDMPNNEQVSERWRKYLTNINSIEQKTGLAFLSNLPAKIRSKLKPKIDSANDEQGSEVTTNEKQTNQEQDNRKYILGPKGGCYYLSDSGKKVYVDKNKCQQ